MAGRGIQHVDLAVSDVDRSLDHPPGEDGDIPGYYAFFVFDPDGFRIEVFSPGPQWSSRIHRPSKTRLQRTSEEEGQGDE